MSNSRNILERRFSTVLKSLCNDVNESINKNGSDPLWLKIRKRSQKINLQRKINIIIVASLLCFPVSCAILSAYLHYCESSQISKTAYSIDFLIAIFICIIVLLNIILISISFAIKTILDIICDLKTTEEIVKNSVSYKTCILNQGKTPLEFSINTYSVENFRHIDDFVLESLEMLFQFLIKREDSNTKKTYLIIPFFFWCYLIFFFALYYGIAS